MGQVKITTFIPVYNMADTVERAILSVLEQDYENKELIVLDGGSTDGTVEVIEKYLDRIAYFASGPDGGSSKAIAMNLVHAAGDIVGMIGADDWYNPGALSAAARTYEQTRADAIYGDVMVKKKTGEMRFVSYANVDLEELYQRCAVFTIAAFIKKELLDAHYKHYFPKYEGTLRIGTDHYVWLRLYHAGRRFAYIQSERPLTNFSMGGLSTSHIYEELCESKKVMELVVGPENPENEHYYRAYERYYAKVSLPCYWKIIGNEQFCEETRRCLGSDQELVLFGAGDYGRKTVRLLRSCGYRIRYVVDNHPERSGGFCLGVPVFGPGRLKREKNATIFVSTLNYEREIFRQLQEMGLDASVTVVTYSDFSWRMYQMLGREILDESWKKGVIH